MFLTRLIAAVLQVFLWLIFVRVILSWVNPRPRNEMLVMVIRVTEPVLSRLRALIPLRGIDLSPLLALLLIEVIRRILIGM